MTAAHHQDIARLRTMYDVLPVNENPTILYVRHDGEASPLPFSFPGEDVTIISLGDLVEPGLNKVFDAEAAFDLVLLHDVIDHLPTRIGRRRVRRMLGELCAMLKPGGTMVWAARNRLDHEFLRRWRPFRTVRRMGSLIWHRRAAQRLGLDQVMTALVVPDLNAPSAIVSTSPAGLGAFYRKLFGPYRQNYGVVKKFVTWAILRFHLGAFLAPAYLVWGRKC